MPVVVCNDCHRASSWLIWAFGRRTRVSGIVGVPCAMACECGCGFGLGRGLRSVEVEDAT